MKFAPIPRSAAVLLAGVLSQLPVTAQSQPQQEIDVSKLGPQAGKRVPDFSPKLGGKTEASVAGTKIPTRHLEITTYPSDPAIAPGDRFSVVLDIEPHSNIHVYAPGAEGYRVISLSIEPNPQVRVLPLQYPVSEIYFFKVLNERVPVFRKSFRLVQELILEGTPQAQAALRGKENVTIQGTLEYQACDDRMCFLPVSVPLAWMMTLRPHVLHQTNRPK
jgi:cytochrome c biogenesis DsbD-like protein